MPEVHIIHIFTPMSRHTHVLGFPPPDDAVRGLLTKYEYRYDESYSRSPHFLAALFKRTVSVITVELKEARSRSERIRQFREFMTDGQTMASVGEKRRKFYKEIVNDVQAVSRIYRLNVEFLHFTESGYSGVW